MRLIDADQFGVISFQGKSEDFMEGVSFILEKIDNAPTVEERPHGEWKYAIVDCYKSGYICPHCNGFAVIDGKSDGYSVTFCPNCGSDNRKSGEAE